MGLIKAALGSLSTTSLSIPSAPLTISTTSESVSAPNTFTPSTCAASTDESTGKMHRLKPSSAPFSATGRTPCTPLNDPSRASSPIIRKS